MARERLRLVMVIGRQRNTREQRTLGLRQNESCPNYRLLSHLSTSRGVFEVTGPLQRKPPGRGGDSLVGRGAVELELDACSVHS